MSQLYSNQGPTNCCFNGQVWATCAYCGSSPRLVQTCTACGGTGTSQQPCANHSGSQGHYSSSMHAVPAHKNQGVRRSSGKSTSGRTVR